MIGTSEREWYRRALGSIYPYDAHVAPARLAAAYLVANTRPGTVIILHEGGNGGRRAVQVLRRVLPALIAGGYRMVTLTELDSLGRTAGMPAASVETGRVSVASGPDELVSRSHSPPRDVMSESGLPGSRLLAVTEEELQRIVLDVHDGPVQDLFAALAQLTALRARLEADGAPTNYIAPVARAVEGVEAALDDIRRTVSTFRTPDLGQRGLAAVVEELVAGHEARTASNVELTIESELPAVSLAATVAVYRIVQEALSNVERHAGVKNAQVRLWAEGARLCAEIVDAGRGFTPPMLYGPEATNHPAHIGLRGMRERVALVNGMLSVESRPGGGTRVHVEVPLNA